MGKYRDRAGKMKENVIRNFQNRKKSYLHF